MARVDPMADVIGQMPEPSAFADTITHGEDNGQVSDGSDLNFDTRDDPIPETVAATETPTDEVFDPNIHCVNEDGSPRRTKTGKLRRKRGKANAQPTPNMSEPDPLRLAKAKSAAQISTAALFVAGQIVFGPEGAPVEGEPQPIEQAFTQFYFLSEKPIEVPPWMLVAMVCSSYAASRLAMEKPRNRVLQAIDWCGDKITATWKWLSTGW